MFFLGWVSWNLGRISSVTKLTSQMLMKFLIVSMSQTALELFCAGNWCTNLVRQIPFVGDAAHGSPGVGNHS